MGRKVALVIGNSEYDDASLARLITPSEDVNDLATLLQVAEVGGFDDVLTLVNESSTTVRKAIARHFKEKSPDDLLLLYFSGHGVLDDQGQLYLAVKDTERDLLSGTAIPAAFLTGEMDRSRSRRQVLMLDCCHSGAFARGSKGVVGASVGTASAFEGTGYGRVVLTATDATQYAWEGERVIGRADNSVFTHFMIEGLETGAADQDQDGRITLDELYDYVYAQVVAQTPRQTPGKWSYRQQGEIVIARNPRPSVQAALPAELRSAIESPIANVRAGAVSELEQLLNSSDTKVVQATRVALQQLAADDSRKVSLAATACLQAFEDKRRSSTSSVAMAGAGVAATMEPLAPGAPPSEIIDTAKNSAVAVPKAYLLVTQGSQVGKSYQLRPGSNIIGRVPGLDVTIPDDLISRRHLRVTVLSDQVLVEDLGSANGTLLNDQKMSGTTAQPLQEGDTLITGNTQLQFTRTAPGASPAAAPVPPVMAASAATESAATESVATESVTTESIATASVATASVATAAAVANWPAVMRINTSTLAETPTPATAQSPTTPSAPRETAAARWAALVAYITARPILFIALGLGLTWIVTWMLLSGLLGSPLAVVVLAAAGAASLGILSYALHLMGLPITWGHAIGLVVGWVVGTGVAWLLISWLGSNLEISNLMGLGLLFGAVAGTLGGITSGIVLKMLEPRLSTKRAVWIIFGWSAAWAIGWAAFGNAVNEIQEDQIAGSLILLGLFTFGTGSAVTLGQITQARGQRLETADTRSGTKEHSPALTNPTWKRIAVVCGTWIAGWIIGILANAFFNPDFDVSFYHATTIAFMVAGWMLAGLVAGMGLRRTHSLIQVQHIALLAIGWPLTLGLSLWIRSAVESDQSAIFIPIGVGVSCLVTLLAVKPAWPELTLWNMLGAALAWGMVWYIVWTILPVDGQPEWLYTLVDFFDSLGLHLSNIVTEQNYLLFILCLGVYIAGRINRLILRVIWRRTVQE